MTIKRTTYQQLWDSANKGSIQKLQLRRDLSKNKRNSKQIRDVLRKGKDNKAKNKTKKEITKLEGIISKV